MCHDVAVTPLAHMVHNTVRTFGNGPQLAHHHRMLSRGGQDEQGQGIGYPDSVSLLRTVLGAIFAFAGFESASQAARSATEVGIVMSATVILASATYMLAAQAAYRLLGHELSHTHVSEIFPIMAAAAWQELIGGDVGAKLACTSTLVVQT